MNISQSEDNVSPMEIDDFQENDIFELDQQECEIAQKLRNVCDEKGREIDCILSAPLLYELGKVYEKRSVKRGKLNLIKSCALFNAAIVRSSNENVHQIEQDLHRLCHLLLIKANAKKVNVDLIKKSKKIKTEFMAMRKNICQKLKKLPFISDHLCKEKQLRYKMEKTNFIKTLQNEIALDYTNIMADVAMFCENIMGKIPCEFALVGMGSLARKEITPYSDFENIIVLENGTWNRSKKEKRKNILKYFRWYSVIFHFLLINLQETIIPSVAISSLNDYIKNDENNWFFDQHTTRGISFDGLMPYACKLPLGRRQLTKNKLFKTELIKPVSEMLKYLHTDEHLKNGYHLRDILTKTCFVYGNNETYQAFEKGVFDILSHQTHQEKLQNVKSQIENDLKNFATKSSLFQSYLKNELNIKKVTYRSLTLFIAALEMIYNIHAPTSFDIIDKLEKKNKISEFAKHKLQYGVAIACEIRLRWYMKNERQTDTIKYLSDQTNVLETIFELVGKSSTISFFRIAYALQCDISKRLMLKKKHFYSNPQLLNLSLYHCMYNACTLKNASQFDCFLQNWVANLEQTERLHNFDNCLRQLEKDTVLTAKISDINLTCLKKSNLREAVQLYVIGDILQTINADDDALEYFLKAKKIVTDLQKSSTYNAYQSESLLQEKSLEEHTLPITAASEINCCFIDILCKIGLCNLNLNNYSDGLKHFKKALKISEQNSNDLDFYCDMSIEKILEQTGECLLNLDEPEEAKEYFEESLQCQKQYENFKTTSFYPDSLKNIGRCFMDMNEISRALKYFDKSLKTRKKQSQNFANDLDLANDFRHIGECLMTENRYFESVKYFEWSVEIQIKASADIETDKQLAECLYDMGSSLLNLNKLIEAEHYFQRSLQIQQRISLDVDIDIRLYSILLKLGSCLTDMKKPDEALKIFDQLLMIIEQASENIECDEKFAIVLTSVASCMLESRSNSNKAFGLLNRSLQIFERISPNAAIDVNFANTLHDIGQLLLDFDKTFLAKLYFETSLTIFQNLCLDEETSTEFANETLSVGDCLINANLHADAVKHFEKALAIETRKSQNATHDIHCAVIKHDIGQCLLKMNKPKEALEQFQNSLHTQQHSAVDIEQEPAYADCLLNIGVCFAELQMIPKAKSQFKHYVTVYERFELSVDDKVALADGLDKIGLTLLQKNEPREALKYFEKELQVNENLFRETDQIKSYLFTTSYQIGCCWLKMNCLENAILFFDKALQTLKQSLTGIDNNETMEAMDDIGNALLEANKPKEAILYFDQSMLLKKQMSSDAGSDLGVSGTLCNLGRCWLNLGNLNLALQFQKSKTILEKIACDLEKDSIYANILKNIGICLAKKNKLAEATQYFDRSMFILEKSSLHEKSCYQLFEIAYLLIELEHVSEGIKYYEILLKLKKQLSETEQQAASLLQVLQQVIDSLLQSKHIPKVAQFMNELIDLGIL